MTDRLGRHLPPAGGGMENLRAAGKKPGTPKTRVSKPPKKKAEKTDELTKEDEAEIAKFSSSVGALLAMNGGNLSMAAVRDAGMYEQILAITVELLEHNPSKKTMAMGRILADKYNAKKDEYLADGNNIIWRFTDVQEFEDWVKTGTFRHYDGPRSDTQEKAKSFSTSLENIFNSRPIRIAIKIKDIDGTIVPLRAVADRTETEKTMKDGQNMATSNLKHNEVRLDVAEDVPFNVKNATFYVLRYPQRDKPMSDETFDKYSAMGLNMVWVK